MGDKLSAQWARVRGRLRAEYGETAYRSWLRPLTLQGMEDGRVRISVPTRFMQDWVETQYGDRLTSLWAIEAAEVQSVHIYVEGGAENASTLERPPTAKEARSTGDEIGAPLDPRFTFENFVVGKPNELAFAAARRVAEADTVPYNPLLLLIDLLQPAPLVAIQLVSL